MTIRLAIRGFGGGKLVFEDRVVIPEDDPKNLMPDVVDKHYHALANYGLWAIEIEFLDEPDPNQRFLRFGSDPKRMVMPFKIEMDKL